MADSGATTSPAFVADLITVLREHASSLERIVLLEQDSSSTRASDLFALLGFTALAERTAIELFDPTLATWRHAGSVGDLPVEIPEIVYEVDVLINVPKLKFHGKTMFTGALKNNFGLLKRKWKLPYHDRLCETIIASNIPLPQQLVVMDGSVALSGRGPSYGIPCQSGVALASWDAVAIDAAGARLLGLPPRLVTHIRMAREAGLGSDKPAVEWEPGGWRMNERPQFDWSRFVVANLLRPQG